MPVYEYECKKCGVFEVEQSIKDNALKTCPTCKGKKLQRLISRTLFTLKGGGWYSQGYGSGGAGSAKPGSSEGKPSSESPAKSESSSKPESPAKSEGTSKPESSSKSSPKAPASTAKSESAAKA